LNAATGIGGGGSFDITGTNLSADTTTGSIDLDSLATAGVTVASLTTGTGNLQLDQVGGQPLVVDLASTANGGITLTNASGALTATDVQTNDGGVNLSAGGEVTATLVRAGDAGGDEEHDVTLTTTAAGNVTLTSVTADDDITVTTAGAAGDILIGAVTASDTVRLTATEGSIADALAGEAANINGSSAVLVASTGIGAAAEDVDVTLANLEAQTATGGIHVADLTGGLTIGGVDGAVTGVRITGAGTDISLVANSPLTVDEEVANHGGGDITLAAQGAAGTDDLDINANVTTTGGNGRIGLYAGDSIEVASSATVSASGTGGILATAGTNYNNGTPVNGTATGALMMQDGSAIQSQDGDIILRAPGAVQLSTINADSDSAGGAGDVAVTANYDGVAGGLADGTGAITDNLTGAGVNVTGDELTLRAATGIALETAVAHLDARVTDVGDVTIVENDDVDLLSVIAASGNVYLEATNGGMTQAAGTITAETIPAGSSTLTMIQSDSLDLGGFTFGNQVGTDLVLQSTAGSVTAVDAANGGQDENAADQWRSVTATAQNSITLQGTESITTEALTSSGDGDPATSDNVSVHSTEGHLVVRGDITAAEGGVSLIANLGKIYTPDGIGDDTLDVAITGYSDHSEDLGVDLDPGGEVGKAAIVIWSERQDLKLGSDAVLTANGVYQPLDPATGQGFDDRLSVNLKDDEGAPIDIAIYLGSIDRDDEVGSDVEMGSGSVHINNTSGVGTLVIDAYDTVTFVPDFESSLADARSDNASRLEVVSRISETLAWAELGLGPVEESRPGHGENLPHTSDPAALADGIFLGTYVLRGATLLESVVLTMTEPVPLVSPVPLELEERDDMEDLDTEALVALLNELGIGVQPHLTGAYAGSLSTDLRLLGAAEKLQKLILTFEDADGTRAAALGTVVAQFFPTFDSLSDEQMDLFRQELTRHSGDGTDYDLAGQVLSALTTYVGILSTDVGWPMDKSMGFVMGRYIPHQMQLQLASGT